MFFGVILQPLALFLRGILYAIHRITRINKMKIPIQSSIFLALLLGWSSIGWIDPMADKIREGNQLYQDGNYDEALDKYVNAQIDSPEIPQLDFNIADVQYKRGKYNEASQLFEKVIKYDDIGMKTKSSFNLGNTLYRQGKMKEALECYKRRWIILTKQRPLRVNLTH